MRLENYTRKQRLAMAEALEKAKGVLWDGAPFAPAGKEVYICAAVVAVGGFPTDLLHGLIAHRLGSARTLRIWLSEQSIPEKELTNIRVQAHRLAWMDLLIAELRGK